MLVGGFSFVSRLNVTPSSRVSAAVSLPWSEDAGTGTRVWSTPPNSSRSGAASRVGEG